MANIELTSATKTQKAGIRQAIDAVSLTDVTGVTAPWGPNDAPILIVLGQSNSYGHATTAPTQVTTPYTNVFTLDRTLNNNALYSANPTSAAISWVGLTTLGKHNIGTSDSGLGAQNHTCNAANQLGKLWQDHINAGNSLGLPNLYVLLIGYGSQGIDNSIGANNRWFPDRSASDVESLYPRAVKTLALAIENIRAQGKNPRVLAVHWNQWESEAGFTDAAADNSLRNFQRIISGINDALGANASVPWRFFWPLSTVYDSAPTRRPKVQKALTALVACDPIHRSFLDVRTAAHYTGVSPNFGVFGADNVHYSATTQTWFAQQEWALIEAGWYGAALPDVKGHTPALLQTSVPTVNVVNDLTTGGSTNALSAQQGVILKELVDLSGTQLKWQGNSFSIQTLPLTAPLPATTFTRVGTDMTIAVLRDTGISPSRKVIRPSCPSGGNKQGLIAFSKAPSDALYGRVRMIARGRVPIAVAFRVKPNTINSFQGLGYGYAALAFYDFGSLTSSDAFGPNKVFLFTLPNSANIGFANNSGAGGNSPTGYIVDTGVWREWEYGLIAANGGTAYIQYRAEGTGAWTVIYSEDGMDAKLSAAGLPSGGIGLIFGLGINDGSTAITSWASTYGSLNLREFEFIPED